MCTLANKNPISSNVVNGCGVIYIGCYNWIKIVQAILLLKCGFGEASCVAMDNM